MLILRTNSGLGIVIRKQIRFADINLPGVLPDVAEVKNAAGELGKFAGLDGREKTLADLSLIGDLVQGDPLGLPDRGHVGPPAQNIRRDLLFHYLFQFTHF